MLGSSIPLHFLRSAILLAPIMTGCAWYRPDSPSRDLTDLAAAGGDGELGPSDKADLCLATAREFERGGKYGEAAAMYERTKLSRPAQTGIAHRLAVLYDRVGDHERAARNFQKAFEEAPRDARLWNDYGYYHYQRERWAEAEAAYRKASELDPKLDRVYVNLGLTLAQQERLDEAFATFTRAVTPAAAHSNLGMVLAQKGRVDEARRAFENAIAAEPGLALPLAARGVLDGANSTIQQANHQTPVTPEAAAQ